MTNKKKRRASLVLFCFVLLWRGCYAYTWTYTFPARDTRMRQRGGRRHGGRGGGGGTHFMHCRSLKTIDPRIPTLPEKEHVGFSPIRQQPSAKHREVLNESHEVRAAPYQRTAFERRTSAPCAHFLAYECQLRIGGSGTHSFVACLSHLTTGHASLFRRSTVLSS